MKSQKVPKEFQALLPSSPVENLEVERDKVYIISNLLHVATGRAWKWMLKTYSKDAIIHVLKTERNLHSRDAYLWMNYYHIPEKDILCLQPEYRKLRNMYWPY